MSASVNFFSAEYQHMEYRYLEEAPAVIDQVISSVKNEAVEFGKNQSLSTEEINSKAFKLAREILPKIRRALEDHFTGSAYELLIRTTMDNSLNQRKRRMVYAPNERDLRKEFADLLQKTQAGFEKANIQRNMKNQQKMKSNIQDIEKI